jgi:hypothetical protein
LKLVIRTKSFPDHKGIPGHQGGSLPKIQGMQRNLPFPEITVEQDQNHFTVPCEGTEDIDYSNAQDWIWHENGSRMVQPNWFHEIKRPTPAEMEQIKTIVKAEQGSLDQEHNTNSAYDSYEYVRLWKGKDYIAQRRIVVSKDYPTDVIAWTDGLFCRCPYCKGPTLEPDWEKVYNACDSCGIEYILKE